MDLNFSVELARSKINDKANVYSQHAKICCESSSSDESYDISIEKSFEKLSTSIKTSQFYKAAEVLVNMNENTCLTEIPSHPESSYQFNELINSIQTQMII